MTEHPVSTPYSLTKIEAMPDSEVVELQKNAERLVEHPKLGEHSREVLSWCLTVIEDRGLSRRSLRVSTRKRSSDPFKVREKELAHELGEFAKHLERKFDLSRETAIRKSVGALRFQAHALTSKDGLAKLGGLQRRGDCSMDRYISYRLRDEIFSVNAYLPREKNFDATIFIVFAPSEMLPSPVLASVLRPEESSSSSMSEKWCQPFLELNDAKALYEDIMARIAEPRL